MFLRHLKNVLSRQGNSKTKLRCLDDVLHRLGIIAGVPNVINEDQYFI